MNEIFTFDVTSVLVLTNSLILIVMISSVFTISLRRKIDNIILLVTSILWEFSLVCSYE